MQTILITGANGFVGQYLTNWFLHDFKVVATGKGAKRLLTDHDNLIYESLDFTEAHAVKAIIEKYKPHIIIHSGAVSKPDDCENNRQMAFDVNVNATAYLLDAAAKQQSFFIFLSTDFVYDGVKGMYMESDEPGNPVNYYGETKLQAELLVKKYSFRWSIVRTVLVYGNPENGRPNILTIVANSLRNGQKLRIFNDQIRTPTYVEDLVKAIVRIAENKQTGIYHISGKDILTPYKMALAVARYLLLDENLIQPETEETFPQQTRRPLKTGFTISKAVQELDYNPVSFEEGLKKTFEERISN